MYRLRCYHAAKDENSYDLRTECIAGVCFFDAEYQHNSGDTSGRHNRDRSRKHCQSYNGRQNLASCYELDDQDAEGCGTVEGSQNSSRYSAYYMTVEGSPPMFESKGGDERHGERSHCQTSKAT